MGAVDEALIVIFDITNFLCINTFVKESNMSNHYYVEFTDTTHITSAVGPTPFDNFTAMASNHNTTDSHNTFFNLNSYSLPYNKVFYAQITTDFNSTDLYRCLRKAFEQRNVKCQLKDQPRPDVLKFELSQ